MIAYAPQGMATCVRVGKIASNAPQSKRNGCGKFGSEGDDGEAVVGFAEIDPTGRYGRYNEVLKEGASKTIYRAFDKFDGMEVAWNQVKVQNSAPKELEQLYSEVHFLKSLNHQNITKFYDLWIDLKAKNVNFITELFTSENIREYRKKHKHVDLKAVKSWARQILCGLLYLHSQDPPIIHRDIKCDNVFIHANNGEVKIGNLGLAVVLKQTQFSHSLVGFASLKIPGMPEFMTLELHEKEHTELVDIYAFGMCVLELIILECPSHEWKSAAQIYTRVLSGEKPAVLDQVKDPEVRNFVEKCLADASSRISARDLLMDPFLQRLVYAKTVVLSPRHHLQASMDRIKEARTLVEEPTKIVANRVGKTNKERLSHLSQAKDLVHKIQALGSSIFGFQKVDFGMHKSIDKNSVSILREPSYRKSQELKLRNINIKADDLVILVIHLTNKKGHSQDIKFDFNVKADTAFTVASEMIIELSLFDHDVNDIAEKIDSELLSLVPNWKPGVAFDDEKNSSDMRCMEQQKKLVKVEPRDLKRPLLDPLQSYAVKCHEHLCQSSACSCGTRILANDARDIKDLKMAVKLGFTFFFATNYCRQIFTAQILFSKHHLGENLIERFTMWLRAPSNL